MGKNRLGRGLFDVISEDNNFDIYGNTKSILSIKVNDVVPNRYQPRIKIDKNIESIINSIKSEGLVQPIIVRQTEAGKYELVAGHRRLTAFEKLGREFIPAIVENYSDKDSAIIAIIENLQREDLTSIEEANAYKIIQEKFQVTHQAIADSVGVNRSRVTVLINALKLPQPVIDKINSQNLSYSHIRKLVASNAPEQQVKEIISKGTPARDFESKPTIYNSTNLLLKDAKITSKGKTLSIKFANKEELEQFINTICNRE